MYANRNKHYLFLEKSQVPCNNMVAYGWALHNICSRHESTRRCSLNFSGGGVKIVYLNDENASSSNLATMNSLRNINMSTKKGEVMCLYMTNM